MGKKTGSASWGASEAVSLLILDKRRGEVGALFKGEQARGKHGLERVETEVGCGQIGHRDGKLARECRIEDRVCCS